MAQEHAPQLFLGLTVGDNLLNHGNAAAELRVHSLWSNSSFQQQSPWIKSPNGQHKGKGIIEQQGEQQWFASVTALSFYFILFYFLWMIEVFFASGDIF